MTATPRNLVICSDGTGNSGRGADGTNVWRLRQAVQAFGGDEAPSGTPQDVIYHDGVGTEAFLPMRILGLAFSSGVTSDLEYLYERLMLQYRRGDEATEGDRLYLFGFSRGAFTIRTLSYMLYRCGLASPFEDDGTTRRSAGEIREIAREAVRAYKMRHLGKDESFRLRFGIPDRLAPENEALRGRIPIRFLGVWDTVSAVGLPFHNLTQFLLQFWRAVTKCPLFRRCRFSLLNFYRPTNRFWTDWENDLHPRIENAFQALSIDDERETFYPMLWIEHEQVTGAGDEADQSRTEYREMLAERVRTLLPVTERTIVRVRRLPAINVEQVWFAGMHANVGGGYDKDHLAHVSLEWMMNHADNCGLKFDENLRDHYRQMADPLGKMHDSRSGLGMLYRYNPRDIEWFSRNAGVGTLPDPGAASADCPLPLIHESVPQRIRDSSQAYAPALLPPPDGYQIVRNPGVPGDSQASRSAIVDVSESEALAACPAAPTSAATTRQVRNSALETIQLFIVVRRAAARWVIYVILIAVLLSLTGLLEESSRIDAAIFGAVGHVNSQIYDFQQKVMPEHLLAPPFLLVVSVLGGGLFIGLAIAACWNWRREVKLPGHRNPPKLKEGLPILGESAFAMVVFLAGFVSRPLARIAADALLPRSLADQMQGILQSGFVFGVLSTVVYVVLRVNNLYRRRIHDWSRYSWDSVMFGRAQQPEAFRVWPRWFADWLFSERHNGPGRYVGRIATRWWFPLMSTTLFAGAVVYALWIPVADLLTRSSVHAAYRETENDDELWDASHTLTTGVDLVRGHHYVVDVEVEQELKDSIVPGDLHGIDLTPDANSADETGLATKIEDAKAKMRLFRPLKRLPSAKYFQLCGCIGGPASPGFEITPGLPFTAESGGPLFLFLNDVPGFGINNHGRMKVTVREVTVGETTDRRVSSE